MRDFEHMPRDFLKAAKKIQRFFAHKAPVILGAQAIEFIDDNFHQQGFQGAAGIESWKPRKTKDKKGKDKRYYKRGRRVGKLTRFGQKEEGRAILVGHDTGGDHMAAAFSTNTTLYRVEILNDKEYAQYHNEGADHLPERTMIAPSPVLDAEAETAIDYFMTQLMP